MGALWGPWGLNGIPMEFSRSSWDHYGVPELLMGPWGALWGPWGAGIPPVVTQCPWDPPPQSPLGSLQVFCWFWGLFPFQPPLASGIPQTPPHGPPLSVAFGFLSISLWALAPFPSPCAPSPFPLWVLGSPFPIGVPLPILYLHSPPIRPVFFTSPRFPLGFSPPPNTHSLYSPPPPTI